MLLLAFIIDMLFASLFFLAVFSKLGTSFAEFKLDLHSYHVLPKALVGISAVGVLLAESMLSILYGFGLFFVWKDIIAILLFSVFTVLTLRQRRLQESTDTSCSCFGQIKALNQYPIVRNMILIALSGGRLALPDRAPETWSTVLYSLAAIMIIASLAIVVMLLSILKRNKELRAHL